MTDNPYVKDVIARHRAEIDRIDGELLSLLNKRAAHSLEIRSLKASENAPRYNASREGDIIDRLCGMNEGPLYDEHVQDLFRYIMKTMRELPSNEGEQAR